MTTATKASNGQLIGYQRVSSEGQNEGRQLDGVAVDRMFTDKLSGKDTQRPQLQAALSHLREGDVLIVHSMDRLGRNINDLRKLVKQLTDKGVKVQFSRKVSSSPETIHRWRLYCSTCSVRLLSLNVN